MKSSVDLESLVAGELRRAIAVDGRSLNAVGKAAGFSKGYLSQLLRGRQDLKLQHVARVLAVLEVHPLQFLRRVLHALQEASLASVKGRPSPAQPERDSFLTPVAPTAEAGESREQQPIESGGGFLEQALREAVREVLRQELPREVVAEMVREYLGTLRTDNPRPVEAGPRIEREGETKKPETPVESIGRRLGLGKRELEAEVKRAKSCVREIVQLDPGKRLAHIRDATSRFRGALFGVLLLEEARRAIPENPAESLSLAEMALLSCERTSEVEPDPEVQAPALAVRGNAKRALGRLREAEQDLIEAKRLLDAAELSDPAFPAEIHRYLGSLRKDQRRLDEAAGHLRHAEALYGLLEQPEEAARVLMALGAVHFRAGEFDAAVEAVEQALGLLPEDSRPWLWAGAHYNRANFLHAAGRLDEAEEELAAHATLISGAGESLDFRVGWLRARIAWSRQEVEKAAALFEETLHRARARAIPYDTGLLCLELALVYLSQGRTGEVKQLSMEALQVFAEEEVDPEVRTALALIEEAARRETLTREMLERTVASLERAQHGVQPAGSP